MVIAGERQGLRVTDTKIDPQVLAIRGALSNVDDPELGIDIVSLGLVREIVVVDGVAHITYTLTSAGCPIGPMIEESICDAVLEVRGIEHVEADLEFDPPWSNEQMTSDARFMLGMY